jgi:hypothetical protein
MFEDIAELRARIQSKIIDSYDCFLNSNINYINENFSSYRRIAFEDISYSETPPFKIDIDSCINFILDSRRDIQNMVFRLKKPLNHFRWDNEIFFPFISDFPEPTWGTQQFWAHRKWQDDLEHTCETEFWDITSNQIKYAQFTKTNIFDNVVFESDKLSFYKNQKKDLYDGEIWLNYVSALIGIFFPMYIYSEKYSNKNMKRYLIEMKKGILFGFEFDQKYIHTELKKGVPELPDYLNLILISEPFNKHEKVHNYYFNENSTILSLGVCGNPYFYPPCFSLSGYIANDLYKRITGDEPIKKIVKSNSGQYQVIHSPMYGECLKKRAFFYMDLLASTSAIYSDYLKKIITNIFS